MEQKIHFFRSAKQKECEAHNIQGDFNYIQCDFDYIPVSGEIIIICPYPFSECLFIGDGDSTCYELFIKKFNNDFDTVQKRLEDCQTIVDQFIHIKESL